LLPGLGDEVLRSSQPPATPKPLIRITGNAYKNWREKQGFNLRTDAEALNFNDLPGSYFIKKFNFLSLTAIIPDVNPRMGGIRT
jgi:hypothetical protein